MPPHTTIPARAAAGTGAALHRGRSALARAALAVGVLAAAATGTVTAGISPAAAAPAVLYAAATAAGTGDCSTTANACTLTTGLADVGPGGTIELCTPGSTAHYLGNWTVGTTGTSAAAPVTIQTAPGLASQPMLDGNRGNSGGCTTASCAGPVLAVGQNEYVALSGITIANGYNHTVPINQDGNGGGLYNSGTVTITGSTFSGNTALFGGAISNGLGTPDGGTGTGSVMATDTTFTGNTGIDGGGAIDSGAGALGTTGGTVTVTASTFSGNNGGSTGGAINSGYAEGAGTVTVTGSTFSGDTSSVCCYGAEINNMNSGTVQVLSLIHI